MAADASNQPVLMWQHDALQRELNRVRQRVDKNSDAITAVERGGAVSDVEYKALREDVVAIRGTLDKLIWAVVGLSFTIAGSAIGIAIAAGVGGH